MPLVCSGLRGRFFPRPLLNAARPSAAPLVSPAACNTVMIYGDRRVRQLRISSTAAVGLKSPRRPSQCNKPSGAVARPTQRSHIYTSQRPSNTAHLHTRGAALWPRAAAAPQPTTVAKYSAQYGRRFGGRSGRGGVGGRRVCLSHRYE